MAMYTIPTLLEEKMDTQEDDELDYRLISKWKGCINDYLLFKKDAKLLEIEIEKTKADIMTGEEYQSYNVTERREIAAKQTFDLRKRLVRTEYERDDSKYEAELYEKMIQYELEDWI